MQTPDNPRDDGFKQMSQAADALSIAVAGEDHTPEGSHRAKGALKNAGVDTDQMVEAAGEQVTSLQQMLIDEIRERPLRALGWAAAAGVVVGLMAAR